MATVNEFAAAEIHEEMSELVDKQVNVQKESLKKTSGVHAFQINVLYTIHIYTCTHIILRIFYFSTMHFCLLCLMKTSYRIDHLIEGDSSV